MNNFLTRSGKLSVIFALVFLLVVSASAQVSLRKALDFDGDGKADFSVIRPSNNYWYVKNTGGSFIYQPFGVSSSDYPAPGDFDGDGKADLSVFRETNGVWYRINSRDNTFFAVQFGTSGDEPVARDYDGDGKTDVAVIRRTGGAMIWYVLGSTGGFTAAQFGIDSDCAAPGDYDGDGKFDYAVQRPCSTGDTIPATFYILNSNGGTLSAVQWGFSNDSIVPGDYDGDGKTDVAVVRVVGTGPNPSLVWYIRGSRNGGLIASQFGLAADDSTAQGDYDGDGKTDIGVWRDSNGTFYVLGSATGGLLGAQWGNPNDVPVANYDSH